MTIDANIVVLFLGLFGALIGFIGQAVVQRLRSIDGELKSLLVDYGQRISVLETGFKFSDRRKQETS